MTPPLRLSDRSPLAEGVQRAVYLHPQNPNLLVKVLKRWEDMPARSNFNGLMDRLFPSTRLRQIRKEYREYLRVMLAQPEADLPISHMFGFVPTDVGLGCLTQAVRDGDGLGRTLGRAKKDGVAVEDVALLNDMIARLYALDIRASDLNPKNIVFGTRDIGAGPGPREAVLVDGFGDIHAIPVRSLGGWANRMGLDDSCRRLARNTGLIWDGAARRFS